MVKLSRSKLRGLAGVAAFAGFAVAALPAAQAAPAAGTATPPAPVFGTPAGTATSVQGTKTFSTAAYNSRTALQTVRYNKLYSTGAIPPSKCPEVNVSLRTTAGVQSYLTQLWSCSYYSWAAPLRAAGAAYKTKPTLIVHNHSKLTTYCGVVSGATAYYCGYQNGQIYMPAYVISNLWRQSPTYARAYATNTLAHEYGHHVQYLTGILNASWWRQRAFSTHSARLEESRRRELQASCLGSASIGANKRYYPMSTGLYTQWKWLVEHSGDQLGQLRDHGSPANHGWWSHAGFYAASTKTYASRCNTWNSQASRVS